MTVNAKLHRVYEFDRAPDPWRAEIHAQDCACVHCAAAHPAVKPVERQLTIIDLGWLAWAGIAVGSAIAFAIDPHGAWHALASCFGVR